MLGRINRWLTRHSGGKITYSQLGEDLIVDALLRELGIFQPTYLDIGAYHPTELSNTALFYSRGCSGVCVEADPTLFEIIRKARKRDLCLNAGVGASRQDVAPFYLMNPRTLNTFSKSTADHLAATEGATIDAVIDVPVLPLNDIMQQHFSTAPNFLSIDTEENDLVILQATDFELYRPQIICVETLNYSRSIVKQSKNAEIPALLQSRDYTVAADTYINSIFIDARAVSAQSVRR